MGQQQLLLVILVTIIVGIATVVAINTFSSASESANVDAVNQDIASIASSAQGYFMKPTMLGGGGNSFSSITFNDIAFGGTIQSDNVAYNENGTYQLSGKSDSSFTVTADPSSGDGYTEGTSGSSSNTITVDVRKDGIDRDQDGTVD